MAGKSQLSNSSLKNELMEKANRSLDLFISKCSNEVFRDYLPAISRDYSVIPYDGTGDVADSVAYFEISQFVENDNEEMIDCLKSVYHTMPLS